MKPHLQQLARLFRAVGTLASAVRSAIDSQVRAHPRLSTGIAIGILAAIAIAWLVLHLKRPTPFEIERRRRNYLVHIGRITDGVILDARTPSGDDSSSPTPEVLIYSYRVAGVTYNCAQDVSALPDLVLGFRLDQSIQVRYDPRNPGNSILVADDWTGLWLPTA